MCILLFIREASADTLLVILVYLHIQTQAGPNTSFHRRETSAASSTGSGSSGKPTGRQYMSTFKGMGASKGGGYDRDGSPVGYIELLRKISEPHSCSSFAVFPLVGIIAWSYRRTIFIYKMFQTTQRARDVDPFGSYSRGLAHVSARYPSIVSQEDTTDTFPTDAEKRKVSISLECLRESEGVTLETSPPPRDISSCALEKLYELDAAETVINIIALEGNMGSDDLLSVSPQHYERKDGAIHIPTASSLAMSHSILGRKPVDSWLLVLTKSTIRTISVLTKEIMGETNYSGENGLGMDRESLPEDSRYSSNVSAIHTLSLNILSSSPAVLPASPLMTTEELRKEYENLKMAAKNKVVTTDVQPSNPVLINQLQGSSSKTNGGISPSIPIIEDYYQRVTSTFSYPDVQTFSGGPSYQPELDLRFRVREDDYQKQYSLRASKSSHRMITEWKSEYEGDSFHITKEQEAQDISVGSNSRLHAAVQRLQAQPWAWVGKLLLYTSQGYRIYSFDGQDLSVHKRNENNSFSRGWNEGVDSSSRQSLAEVESEDRENYLQFSEPRYATLKEDAMAWVTYLENAEEALNYGSDDPNILSKRKTSSQLLRQFVPDRLYTPALAWKAYILSRYWKLFAQKDMFKSPPQMLEDQYKIFKEAAYHGALAMQCLFHEFIDAVSLHENLYQAKWTSERRLRFDTSESPPALSQTPAGTAGGTKIASTCLSSRKPFLIRYEDNNVEVIHTEWTNFDDDFAALHGLLPNNSPRLEIIQEYYTDDEPIFACCDSLTRLRNSIGRLDMMEKVDGDTFVLGDAEVSRIMHSWELSKIRYPTYEAACIAAHYLRFGVCLSPFQAYQLSLPETVFSVEEKSVFGLRMKSVHKQAATLLRENSEREYRRAKSLFLRESVFDVIQRTADISSDSLSLDSVNRRQASDGYSLLQKINSEPYAATRAFYHLFNSCEAVENVLALFPQLLPSGFVLRRPRKLNNEYIQFFVKQDVVSIIPELLKYLQWWRLMFRRTGKVLTRIESLRDNYTGAWWCHSDEDMLDPSEYSVGGNTTYEPERPLSLSEGGARQNQSLYYSDAVDDLDSRLGTAMRRSELVDTVICLSLVWMIRYMQTEDVESLFERLDLVDERQYQRLHISSADTEFSDTSEASSSDEDVDDDSRETKAPDSAFTNCLESGNVIELSPIKATGQRHLRIHFEGTAPGHSRTFRHLVNQEAFVYDKLSRERPAEEIVYGISASTYLHRVPPISLKPPRSVKSFVQWSKFWEFSGDARSLLLQATGARQRESEREKTFFETLEAKLHQLFCCGHKVWLSEVAYLLEQEKLTTPLCMLYWSVGSHEKAVNVLMQDLKHAAKSAENVRLSNSTCYNRVMEAYLCRLLDYLQRLGGEHGDIILSTLRPLLGGMCGISGSKMAVDMLIRTTCGWRGSEKIVVPFQLESSLEGEHNYVRVNYGYKEWLPLDLTTVIVFLSGMPLSNHHKDLSLDLITHLLIHPKTGNVVSTYRSRRLRVSKHGGKWKWDGISFVLRFMECVMWRRLPKQFVTMQQSIRALGGDKDVIREYLPSIKEMDVTQLANGDIAPVQLHVRNKIILLASCYAVILCRLLRNKPSDKGRTTETGRYHSSPDTRSSSEGSSMMHCHGWQLADSPSVVESALAGLDPLFPQEEGGNVIVISPEDEENPKVAVIRKRLMALLSLKNVWYYDFDTCSLVLSLLPKNACWEEKSLLLCHSNNHLNSLRIVAHVIADHQAVLTYCHEIGKTVGADIYVQCLEAYLLPPPLLFRSMVDEGTLLSNALNVVLRIEHADQVQRVIDRLPSEAPAHLVAPVARRVFQLMQYQSRMVHQQISLETARRNTQLYRVKELQDHFRKKAGGKRK